MQKFDWWMNRLLCVLSDVLTDSLTTHDLKYTSGKTNGGLSHGWLRREVIDDSTLRAMQCREVEVKGCCWEDEGRF